MARLRPPFDHCGCEACVTGIRELERQLRAFQSRHRCDHGSGTRLP